MVNFSETGYVKAPFSFSLLADAIFIYALRLLTFVPPISLRCVV